LRFGGMAGAMSCAARRATVEALNEAIARFGPPEIMNTNLGSQFASLAWSDRPRRSGARISMGSKARFLPSHRLQANACRTMDTVFVQRLWRSLKYECVNLHAREAGSEARAGVGKWIEFHNHKRPHSALGASPPRPWSIGWERTKPKSISRRREWLSLRQNPSTVWGVTR